MGVGGLPAGSEVAAGGRRAFSGFVSLSFLQFAIKNRWRRSEHDPDRKHWLDWAEEKYSVTVAHLISSGARLLLLEGFSSTSVLLHLNRSN